MIDIIDKAIFWAVHNSSITYRLIEAGVRIRMILETQDIQVSPSFSGSRCGIGTVLLLRPTLILSNTEMSGVPLTKKISGCSLSNNQLFALSIYQLPTDLFINETCISVFCLLFQTKALPWPRVYLTKVDSIWPISSIICLFNEITHIFHVLATLRS